MKRLNALLRSFRNMRVQVRCNIINVEYYTDRFVQPVMKHFNSYVVYLKCIWQSVCSGACCWKNITKPSIHGLNRNKQTKQKKLWLKCLVTVHVMHKQAFCRSVEGVFTWENSHRHEFHSWDDFLILYHVIYMMTGSFHISLFEGTLHVDKIHVWFKIANITQCYPLQSTGRLISQWNVWSFCVYMMLLQDFILEWNSRPSTTTGVKLTPAWHFVVVSCKQM